MSDRALEAPSGVPLRQASRLAGVDSLRGAAAIAVLVCHVQAYCLVTGASLPWPLPQVFNNGAHGVDLFVVVSGFCLGLPLMHGEGLRVRNFYLRRAFRLLPAYYVALAVGAALASCAATAAYVVGRPAGVTDVVLHAFLLQTVVPGHVGTINGSLWSVALEVQLYLLFPATLAAYRRFGGTTLLAATGVLSLGWGLLEPLHLGILGAGYLLPARLVQFVAGMWAAQQVASGGVPAQRRLWLLAGTGVLGGLVVSTLDVNWLSPIAWAVPSVAALLALTRIEPALLVPFERFGVITYSFYLLHQPVLLMLAPVFRTLSNSPFVLLLLGLVVGGGVTAALAALLYRWVELPSQTFARRWPVTTRPPQVALQ